MLATSDFPQADKLHQVGLVAIAIAKGNHTDSEIESFIGLGSKGRQGRYYRLSAEILGLVENQKNNSQLTGLGVEFATLSSDSARIDFLSRCLVETPVFNEALRYINSFQPTLLQLKLWFKTIYPGSANTAERRFSTFLNYLNDSGLLNASGPKILLQKYSGGVIKNKTPQAQALNKKRVKSTPPVFKKYGDNEFLNLDISFQKRERANQIHWELINAKSLFLGSMNLVPYDNDHIDLYTDENNDVIMYEMKSVSENGGNLLSQVRKAISQLYEYRYIYEEPNARLCIVTNHLPTKSDDWIQSYLARDRLIAYEWTEDFKTFNCKNESSSLLGSFAP